MKYRLSDSEVLEGVDRHVGRLLVNMSVNMSADISAESVDRQTS